MTIEDKRKEIKKSAGTKLYRGAFKYLRNGTVYCTEEFEVYKHRKELSLRFFSDIHSRVATGELLNIHVDYGVTKDFVPDKVIIEKDLGTNSVVESYIFDRRRNVIRYQFKTRFDINKKEINTGPKFHITTPTSATSMLFIRSKKEDPTSKNSYNVVMSSNQWRFTDIPVMKILTMQRLTVTSENLNLGGQNVQATQYKLYEDLEDNDKDNPITSMPTVKMWLSKHLAIPYMIKSKDGTCIQIQYLHDLDQE